MTTRRDDLGAEPLMLFGGFALNANRLPDSEAEGFLIRAGFIEDDNPQSAECALREPVSKQPYSFL